jgi:polyvinyl alcohol dehydrogenase (cytochrome)
MSLGSTLGGVQWGSAADDASVYVAVSDVGMKAVPPATAGAQKSVFGITMKLDPSRGGGLYAMNQATGEIVWHAAHPGCGDRPGCSPAQSAAVTEILGVVFSGGLDGHLRAYAAKSGEIIWDVDTIQDYATVNGVSAHGGSLDGPGPVIAGASSTPTPATQITVPHPATCCSPSPWTDSRRGVFARSARDGIHEKGPLCADSVAKVFSRHGT